MMRRIYHHWAQWESVAGGLYESSAPAPMSPEDATRAYAAFLSDIPRFRGALQRVIREWTVACEHFLTNENINRIAWLGQASMCIETRVPRRFRGGFCLLDDGQQCAANAEAESALRQWMRGRGDTSLELSDGSDAPHDCLRVNANAGPARRANAYCQFWSERGYPDGIPDEVPAGVMEFAPSYRAICEAILRNDVALHSLGFTTTPSEWYRALKRIEIAARPQEPSPQMDLPWGQA